MHGLTGGSWKQTTPAMATVVGQPRGKPQEQRLRDLPPVTVIAPAPDPTIPRACPAPPQPVGIGLAELRTPLSDGFVGHHDPTLQHHLFDLAEAEREPVIEPH